MKRYLVALLLLLSSSFPRWGYAANTDIFALQGGGALNNVDVFRVESTGVVDISSFTAHSSDINMINFADINFGSLTVAQSTANTTQTGQGAVYTAFLASSTSSALSIAALEGSVICATTTQQGSFVTALVCPAVAAGTGWIGVADAAASTGTVINILSAGSWALAQTTGTVNPGDMLMTSSLASGFLQATVTSTNNVVAVALAAGPSGGGLTKVRLR